MLDEQAVKKEIDMPKARQKKVSSPDMLPEYDFTGAVRGKYAKQFKKGSNVVVLEPDVAKAFPSARAVNDALRSLAHKQAK